MDTTKPRPTDGTTEKLAGDTERLRESVCIFSEKFGIEIWIVPEHTGLDRVEYTPEEILKLGAVLDAFGGRIVSLTVADGRVIEPIPGWEARARLQKRLDLETHLDLVVEHERVLRASLDDPETPPGKRRQLLSLWQEEVLEVERLTQSLQDLTRDAAVEEMRDEVAGGPARSVSDETPGADTAPTLPTLAEAREQLRREL